MKPREIRPGIHAVGAIDWDRRLFDALIPLPDGTSYNSYLVKGSEKTVLIDTVDPTMEHELWHHLADLNCQHLDYVVANHAEQDHSGTLLRVLEKYPQARVLCTPRCKGMLMDFLHETLKEGHTHYQLASVKTILGVAFIFGPLEVRCDGKRF